MGSINDITYTCVACGQPLTSGDDEVTTTDLGPSRWATARERITLIACVVMAVLGAVFMVIGVLATLIWATWN